MTQKIVFFDIDGTLLDFEKNLPENTIDAINKLKENGTYVAIATGRGPFMFDSIREKLGIQTFVSLNGQYVVFENEVIFKNPLPLNVLESLYREAKSNDHPLVLMSEHTMKATVNYHKFIEIGMNSLNMEHPKKDEYFHIQGDIYQALLFCEKIHDKQYIEKFSNLNFIRWHQFSTDVLPAGGSKANGIKKIIENLGFQIDDVYAFGDGLNDIEMLKLAGTAVVMGNGLPEVKKHADYITTDVDDNGIWNGLKELGLI